MPDVYFSDTSIYLGTGEGMGFEEVLKLLQSKEEPLKQKGADELWKSLYQPLMGFYRRRKLNKFEAEDVIMISLVKMYKKADTVKEPKKFKGWCWEVARNSMYDNFKKNKKYKNDVAEISIDKYGEEYYTADKNEIVTRVTKEREKTGVDKCVQLAIQEFAKDMPDRALVMQLKAEGLTNEQISLRTGKTLAATKESVSQTYKKFRPYIEHCREGNNK